LSVQETFTVASGTYVDEQALLGSIDAFMASGIAGWTQLKVITDTASDKDIVYYSDGDGTRDRNIVRLRATSNNLEFHTYSVFNTGTDTGLDDLYNSETAIPTSTSSGIYWLFGNKDSVYVSVEHDATSNKHLGGFGTWISYYDPADDPKPFFVFGQSSSTKLFNDSTERCRSYGPGSFGSTYYPYTAGTSLSGTIRNYMSEHSENVKYGVTQARTNQPYIFEPVFFTIETSPYIEARGEMPGLNLIGSAPYSNGNIITISGINAMNGFYFIQDHDDSSEVCWALGRLIL
jgi:hypothetical protein